MAEEPEQSRLAPEFIRQAIQPCAHSQDQPAEIQGREGRRAKGAERRVSDQAAFQQRNSELSHQVNDLQDQLQAESANTQEIINLERAERERLEGKFKEERAKRERLLEAERTSRLKFEKKT
ncbi:hypothetical protein ZWY2020_010387 [Hordeum vulgare]|nr:hypothetical protein ZWY2020_010387 [Hordeum vulgare]